MNFPNDRQRLAVIGATGSGKTQAALWHLSHRHFDSIPWVIYDYKTDPSIRSIPHLRSIELDQLPVEPGIFAVTPDPDDQEAVERHMRAVWKHGNMGVYVDEGYMVGQQNPAFRRLLTQGRSRGIPMIVLSQRPVWMDRFVFSESEFFQVFRLQHRKDVAQVEEFIPARLDQRLPEFHSWYYDSLRNELRILKPVPALQTILRTFDSRLRPLRKVI